MSKSHHRLIFIWTFSLLWFIFFVYVFVFAPKELPEFRYKMISISSALLASLTAFFLTGEVVLKYTSVNSRLGQLTIIASSSFAVFIFVMWWWTTSLAPIQKSVTPKELNETENRIKSHVSEKIERSTPKGLNETENQIKKYLSSDLKDNEKINYKLDIIQNNLVEYINNSKDHSHAQAEHIEGEQLSTILNASSDDTKILEKERKDGIQKTFNTESIVKNSSVRLSSKYLFCNQTENELVLPCIVSGNIHITPSNCIQVNSAMLLKEIYNSLIKLKCTGYRKESEKDRIVENIVSCEELESLKFFMAF